VLFDWLPPGFAFFLAAQGGGLFAFCFGLSLFCFWFISVAPVRGGTYFSLQRQRKVGKRKPLTPLTFRCPPLFVTGSGPKTRSSLAPLASVTQQSSAPASRFAPRRQAQHPTQPTVGFVRVSEAGEATAHSVPEQSHVSAHKQRASQTTSGYAEPTRTECVGGMDERCVTNEGNARAGLVLGRFRIKGKDGSLLASGVSPLSLLTFFAAAKKVSAAPHRGEANRPLRKQGKANAVGTPPNAVGKSNPKAKTESGVAIISALLVVALSAILVSGILWRQQVQIRRIENQRLLSQAQWISRGALDWTRLILRSEGDTSAGITYLGGVWGVPIAKTRLSDFLGQIGEVRASEGAATYLSGSIEDAQSKFNLRNLVSSPAPGVLQVNVEQVQAFQRLLMLLSLNSQLAKTAAVQIRDSLAQSATRFQTQTGTTSSTTAPVMGGAIGGNTFTDKPGIDDSDSNPDIAPLQMTSVDSLLDVPGFTPEMIARLRPFVTYLPTTTAVNMNTAPAEVIAAIVPEMNLSSAQALVARRQTVFFRNVGDVQLALTAVGIQSAVIDPSIFDVNTSYFFIHGRVDHERAEVDRTTLVYRDALTHTTRIVRVQDQL
jgi:general secretion pathway protein K